MHIGRTLLRTRTTFPHSAVSEGAPYSRSVAIPLGFFALGLAAVLTTNRPSQLPRPHWILHTRDTDEFALNGFQRNGQVTMQSSISTARRTSTAWSSATSAYALTRLLLTELCSHTRSSSTASATRKAQPTLTTTARPRRRRTRTTRAMTTKRRRSAGTAPRKHLRS